MNKDLKEKLAFTLAEVLITLGIIGVVSALTIPTLIKKYQEKVTVTKLKQSYSMLAQAFQMAVNENGPVTSWDLGTGISDPQSHINLANYLKPYLKLNHDCVGKSDDYTKKYCNYPNADRRAGAAMVLSNGTRLKLRLLDPDCKISHESQGNSCAYISTAFFAPYESGKNAFTFDLTTKGIIPWGSVSSNYVSFKTYCNPAITTVINGVSPMSGCTAWVIYNGNMDYLRCFDKLSWDGAHSCKEAEEQSNK